jgi:hypothetical protein
MFEAAAEGEAQVKIPIINSQDQDLTKRLTFTVRIRVESAKTSPAPNAFTTTDQTNTAPWKNGSINVHNSLSQTFTPSLPILTALEVARYRCTRQDRAATIGTRYHGHLENAGDGDTGHCNDGFAPSSWATLQSS